MDTNKSTELTDAPQPRSVSQTVFVGELCDRESAELDHTGRKTVAEQNIIVSILLRDCERAESKTTTLDGLSVGMASCLTLIVPNWIKIAIILGRVFVFKTNCRTVSGQSRKLFTLDRILWERSVAWPCACRGGKKTLHRNTVVMVSSLTMYVPSWNGMALMLDIFRLVHSQLPDCQCAKAKNKTARQI